MFEEERSVIKEKCSYGGRFFFFFNHSDLLNKLLLFIILFYQVCKELQKNKTQETKSADYGGITKNYDDDRF